MIDLLDTAIQIVGGAEWITPELAIWLTDCGAARSSILYLPHNPRDQAAAYNVAVGNAISKAGKKKYSLIIDRDVRPNAEHVKPFLAMPHDFTCVRYATECGDASWAIPTAFHTAMWCCEISKLATIKGPWFGWRYNQNHSEIIGCQCSHFAKLIVAQNYTIGYAGYCEHEPRTVTTRPGKVFHD